ncbi:MAG: glycosyltransferase [Ferruginibacter sp.]
MNVLFLPVNIASMQAITAEALNGLEGIEAKCLTVNVHKYQTANSTIIVLPERFVSRRNPFKWLYAQWNFKRQLKKWIVWADVLHYIWGPAYESAKDLRWAKKMKKPVFIEWAGSDIRDPELLSEINKYFKYAYNNGYEYREFEGGDHRKIVQQQFYDAAAKPLLSPEMSLFLNKKLFPEYLRVLARININEFIPEFPSVQNLKPLIIHSPSAKIAKGSNLIIAVVEELKKEFDFEFMLLHDLKREDVLKIVQQADIFIDQIICGGYGMATMEALAFGKPVLCYLIPELFKAGLPIDCPIVNTNPDNLREQLIRLIANPGLRYDIGRQSRVYVEKYHDAQKISIQLAAIYKQALAEKNKTNA